MELKALLFLLLGYLCVTGEGLGDGGAPPVVPTECVQKLIVCEPYLKGTAAPPPSCCIPLKEMITGDPTCLCSIFNNPSFLKSLNITQDDALHLPKACGANADISVCQKGVAPVSAPSTPLTPSNSTQGSGNSTAAATHKSAASNGVTGATFVSVMLPLLISAF